MSVPSNQIDLNHSSVDKIRLVGSESTYCRHNFDGFFCSNKPSEDDPPTYVQLFRNGSIEIVWTKIFQNDTDKLIASLRFEKVLVDVISYYLRIQESLGVEPPIFIMVTLSNIVGYSFKSRIGINTSFDRDLLAFPELMFEKFDVSIGDVLRPIFDAIWNAAGFPGSAYYDENGKWTGDELWIESAGKYVSSW